MSHTLDYELFKNWAGGHHLVNILFHIANTILLFYFLKKTTSSMWASAFVAAAFALHPLHVESVAWVAERKDVLSTFFWLLTMLAYANYTKNLKLKWYLSAIILFIFGLMSKPMLVTVPFVLLLLDYWPLERKLSRRLLIEKVPFLICSVLSCVVTFIFQQKAGAITNVEYYGFKSRALNIIVSYTSYIFKMIWPGDLAVLYPYPASGFPIIRIIISVIIFLAITIFVIRFGRRYKFFIFGWLWYVGTLVPVIGFIQIGAHAMADRYTYMPFVGLFIIIVFAVKEFVPKQQYKLVILSAASILMFWSVSSFNQVVYWKDSLTLFKHTLDVTKNNFIILTNYAASLNDAGRYEDAIKYSHKLLELKPNCPENHNCLGSSLLNMGRIDEAIDEYQLALKYKPNFPQTYYNLGLAVRKFNNFEQAALFFQKAIEYKPDYIEAYVNLTTTLNQLQRFEESIEVCGKALQVDPDNVFVHGYLAMALSGAGRNDEAIEEIKYVLKQRPNDSQMYRNLGILLAKKGLESEAAAAYQQALRIDPNDTNTRLLLGKLLKEANEQ